MPAQQIPSSVNELTVLPLKYPATKAFPQDATHYLYLRANAPKLPTEDTPREVFLVNVPIDATELHIKSLFANQLGGPRVESVSFEGTRIGRGITAPVASKKKRKRGEDEPAQLARDVGALPKVWDRDLHQSGSTAVVTFVDKPSAEMAMREAKKAAKSSKGIVWALDMDGKVPSLGRSRYAAHHKLRYPPATQLQASVDTYMAAFTAVEAERAKALAKQRAVPDDDGFITVVRGGRAGPAREEEAKAKEEVLKQREKDRVKGDFYRFQVREKRKEEAQKLVTEFEQDRQKVDDMRKRKGRIRPE
ncbi:hypothetical protein AMS68_002525 [Peltaster fructicola]|uniref:Ribosomal RNA-processing protein 7 C-terminal domain-containing protein n=1 Tax=Peltaster fructicola TaxID=286661 RepID=A0A6H0XQT9_9PEZI|nr:hypothetical protein AMS68_002525 [Peltaster fructicola]